MQPCGTGANNTCKAEPHLSLGLLKGAVGTFAENTARGKMRRAHTEDSRESLDKRSKLFASFSSM